MEGRTSFVNEVAVFPTKGIHDDQVDTLTGGLSEIFKRGGNVYGTSKKKFDYA